jgi:hypothetical protein
MSEFKPDILNKIANILKVLGHSCFKNKTKLAKPKSVKLTVWQKNDNITSK